MTKPLNDQKFMNLALQQAQKGLDQGGVPIGSVLVVDGKVVGAGHNQRVQKGSPILHGEMDCLENAGRLKASEYQKATIYTTLSPCDMCTGAILLYKIPRVVLAENETFMGAEERLRGEGVEVINLDLQEAKNLMNTFIEKHPEIWNEDIGED